MQQSNIREFAPAKKRKIVAAGHVIHLSRPNIEPKKAALTLTN